MQLTILGARGSMPTGGNDFIKYGSDTSSYLIETEKTAVFLDAGTGICRTGDIRGKRIAIFLSHMHLDHIIGLSFFPMLFKAIDIDIYAAMPSVEIKANLDRLFSTPFWPCKLDDFQANVHYKSLAPIVEFEDLKITSIKGNHPGGCMVYKVSNNQNSISYVTDYEHGSKKDAILIDFIKDSSIMLYDGQYTESEYKSHKGFGHSTKEMGLKFSKEANCKQLYLTHHDPSHTDTFLDNEKSRLLKLYPKTHIARQGDVIHL